MNYLGIDGGGSKTTFLLADAEDHEIQRIQTGPTNWLSVGQETAMASIRDGISRLSVTPDIVCGGFAGAGRSEGAAFYAAALKSVLPKARILIKSDAFVSYIGAIGIEPGVLLIAGTGSIAIGRRPDGSMIRVGGWGPHFGDEGSGFWIGREAVRAALRKMDSNTEPGFTDRISGALGLTCVTDVPAAWSAGRIGVPEIAGLFRELVQIYPTEPSERILTEAAAHLKDIATTALQKVGLADCPRVLSGSVATHPIITSLIGMPFHEPRRSPEWGAILWARQAPSDEKD